MYELPDRVDPWAPMRDEQRASARRLNESALVSRVMAYSVPELIIHNQALGLTVDRLSLEELRAQLFAYHRMKA